MEALSVQQLNQRLLDNVEKVIVGKREVIEKIVIALLCGGHVLLEDIPGTGKTTLAKTLARSIDCKFARVQFTPDLLPSDLTGINYYNQKEQEFVFKSGSIFTNILLGDEINRATPRTQSSLLECMEERQVTVDGTTYPLQPPFFVIATQNPIETQGTFPLPEAQLDRFFIKLSMGYPSADKELEMLVNFRTENPLSSLEAVLNGTEIVQAQEQVKKVTVSDAIGQYIIAIAEATRTHDDFRLGLSPRGALALMRAAQALAAVRGRNYVLPDDVKEICPDVAAHRIIGAGNSLLIDSDVIKTTLDKILHSVPVPTEQAVGV